MGKELKKEDQQPTEIGKDIKKAGSLSGGRAWALLSCEKFPDDYTGSVKPKQLKACLLEYRDTTDTLRQVLQKHGIGEQQYRNLKGKYIEIQRLITDLRREKSDLLRQKAQEEYDFKCLSEIPDYVKQESKNGEAVSMAGVRLLENKYKSLVDAARFLEAGGVSAQQQQERAQTQITAGQININVTDILQSPLSDLQRIDWQE